MKSIFLILILFFSSCLAQSCFDSNGIYISSIIPANSNGGEAIFFGCFLTNGSMTINIGNTECSFINQTDYEYICYAQPGNGVQSVNVLIDGLIYYTLYNSYYYYDGSATTTTYPSTTYSSSTTNYPSTTYSSSTTSYPSTTFSSSTTSYPSTTYSSSTTSYPSSSSESLQPTICEYNEWGLTINGSSSSFIKCNGYGQTYCVDNIGGSTCQSDTNVLCTVQSKVSNENSMTCFGKHIQCSSLYARCSINIPNNQFHVNGELQTSNIVEISSPNETKEINDLGSPSSSSSSSSLYVPTTVSIIIFVIISIL
ncbi:hypothetical protein ACTFIY_003073 [Dictyostelium cf. discoideum]